jgi:hypothetical protein
MNKKKKDYYVFLYIGRKGSGKTTLMFKHIMKIKKNVIITLISKTAKSQDIYLTNEKYIKYYYSDLSEEVINEILERRKKDQINKHVIIFDDVGSEKFMKRERTVLQEMINNTRHYKLDLIFLIQRLTQTTVTTRENADAIFCFKLWDLDETKLFKKTFFGTMPLDDFKKYTDAAWERPQQPYGYITLYRYGNQYRYGIDNYIFPLHEQHNILLDKLKAPAGITTKPEEKFNYDEQRKKFDKETKNFVNKYIKNKDKTNDDNGDDDDDDDPNFDYSSDED